jgi:L1 cell adhesion molecule like protein
MLRAYCHKMMEEVRSDYVMARISDADKTTIIDNCNATLLWPDIDEFASKEDLMSWRQELTALCDTIIENLP